MRQHTVSILTLVLLLAVAAGAMSNATHAAQDAKAAKPDIPDKAECTTCSARGAVHGEEDVVAWREHDGRFYYFCSEPCAETFDGFPEAYAVQPLPRPAPQMVLTTTGKQQIVVGRADGPVLLVDFWATWCAPCIKALPELEAMQREFGGDSFSVVGISIDEDAGKLDKFLRKRDMAYPVVHDSGDEPAWHSFLVAAIPSMFLIDGAGQIVAHWRGDVDLHQVREAVEAHATASKLE